MTTKDELEQLIANNRRRLQILKEQKALLGLDAKPKLIIEIQDIEQTLTDL